MTLSKEIEAGFKRLWDGVSIPGAVSFHGYRAIQGEDHFQFVSAIEFKGEAPLRRVLDFYNCATQSPPQNRVKLPTSLRLWY